DTGKTALLEGLCILLASTNGQISALPSAFRTSQRSKEDNLQSFWEWLFFEKNTSLITTIRGISDDKSIFAHVVAVGTSHSFLIYHDHGPQGGAPRFNIGAFGMSEMQGSLRPKLLIQSTRLGDPVNDAELY